MPSILFVCTANQCRSPMAMALMREGVEDQNLEEWNVTSAGTWAIEGVPATDYAIEVMREKGLRLENHRSQRVTAELLRENDLILVMERNHKEVLQIEFPEFADQIYLLSEMIDEEWDVVDPIGKSIEEYRITAELVDQAIQEGWDRITHIAKK